MGYILCFVGGIVIGFFILGLCTAAKIGDEQVQQ